MINLAPDKEKVLREAFRVLKLSGRMYISEMDLLAELPEDLKNNKDLLAGCVAGAILEQDYLDFLKKTGFSVEILSEDALISKRQYKGMPVEGMRLKTFL